MQKVLDLQKIGDEVEAQIGPTILTFTILPTTFMSLISNHCDTKAS